LLLVALAVACRTAPPPPDAGVTGLDQAVAAITRLVQTEMGQKKVAGLSIAVVESRGVLWEQGFGLADGATGRPATPGTVYGVGSVTKLFTGVAILQLAERGLVDLDRPVTAYIPELAVRSRFGDIGDITVRTLMTHHSGLPGDRAPGMWADPEADFRDVVQYLSTQYTAYPPDRIFAYCNLGVDLLGVIIERLCGESYVDYLAAHVLEPLGMSTASAVPIATRTDLDPALVARAHAAGKRGSLDEPVLRDLPAGSLNGSVRDIARFIRMVLAGGEVDGRRILAPESLERMLTPQNRGLPLDFGQELGLSFFLTSPRLGYAGRYAGHGGDTLYHHASVGMLLDHDLGVVVLTNTDTGGAVAGEIATRALQLVLEARTGLRPPADSAPVVFPNGDPGEDPASLLAGEWASVLGYAVLAPRGDSFRMTSTEGRFLLEPAGDGWYSLKALVLGLVPVRVASLDRIRITARRVDGEKVLVAASRGDVMAAGAPITREPLPGAWAARAGHYRLLDHVPAAVAGSQDLRDPVLLVVDGLLRLGPNGPSSAGEVLLPVSDTEAIIAGIGRGARETVFIRSVDGREVLEYRGYRFERVGK